MRAYVGFLCVILFIFPSVLFSLNETVVLDEVFNAGLPTGWQNVSNISNTQVWQFNDPGTSGFNAFTNNYAILNSDSYGNNNTQNSSLITSAINCTGLTKVMVSFNQQFRSYSGSSIKLEISTNGTIWQQIMSSVTDLGYPDFISSSYNISSIAANQSSVYLKWTYVGTWGYWWAISNVKVSQPGVIVSLSSPTSNVAFQGMSDFRIMGINLTTMGSSDSLTITQMSFSTNGTTDPSDITHVSAIVYDNFGNQTTYGSIVNNPNGTFTINGSLTVPSTDSWFEIAYDISPTAVEGHVIDLECNSFTINGITYTADTVAPIGNAIIRIPMSGIYTIDQSGSGSRNFTSLRTAINALDTLGVNGPVVFNIPAGQVFNEYYDMDSLLPLRITATGTETNTITFQKQGIGDNPLLLVDVSSWDWIAGLTLEGSSYVTIDGLDIREVDLPTYGNLSMGYQLLGTELSGCNYNVIKNCSVNLNKDNDTYGVYSEPGGYGYQSSHNNNNKFLDNLIEDCNYGYYLLGYSTNDSNNEIGSLGGSSIIKNFNNSGIYFGYQSNLKIYNTTIDNSDNANSIYTSTGITSQNGTGNSADIYNNTITSFSTVSSIGISLTVGANYNIFGNTITGLSSSANLTYGIRLSSVTGICNVYKNKISDLSYTGTASGTIYGLALLSVFNNNVYNNQIYDLRVPFGGLVNGLYLTGSVTLPNNARIFNNTVFLNYTSTGAVTNRSMVFYSSNATSIDLRNNIFVNKVNISGNTNSTSFTTVISKNVANFTNYSTNTNNNLYYGGIPSSRNMIYTNQSWPATISDSTLAQYKSRAATFDQNSVTENVPFLSSVTPYNLHIQTSIATQVESGGQPITSPIAVTDDFEGNVRNSTNPDLGAYEGTYTLSDNLPPAISLTSLSNTAMTLNRTVSGIVITDLSGIDVTTNNKPRLYYKKKSQANIIPATNDATTNGWKYVVTSSTASPFSFIIDYSKLYQYSTSPVAVGDTIQYFVLAKDNASVPNVGTYPSFGSVTTYSTGIVLTTPPTTPLYYSITQSISGTKTVGGSSPNYANLTAAFADINAKTVTGNIVLSIAGNTSEPSQAVLNQISCEGGNYTVSIKPSSGVTPVISGNVSDDGLIKLNHVSNVTIDGSNTSGGSSKDLKIWNYAATGMGIVISNYASGCTVKNTIIKGNSSLDSDCGIYLTGNNNNMITISNNTFQKFFSGIYCWADSYELNASNLTISDNLIGDDADSLSIGNRGIFVNHASQLTISGNQIKNIKLSTNPKGMDLNKISSASISNNIIHDIAYTGGTSYGGKGLEIYYSSNVRIANNVIYNIFGRGSTSLANTLAGIRIYGSGTNYNLYYNTVNIAGISSLSGSGKSMALYISAGISGITLKNNVLVNTISFPAGSYTKYPIYSEAPSSAFSLINYNTYYASGTNAYWGHIGSIDMPAVSYEQWTFDIFRNYTGQDQQSMGTNPLFVTDTDLRPSYVSPLWHAGSAVSGITTDVLGVTRSVSTPTIGAYENKVTGDMNPPVIAYTLLNNTNFSGNRTLSVTITDDISGINTTTAKPRLYYKKMSENNSFGANSSTVNGWKWVEPSNLVSPFSFTINYDLLHNPLAEQDTLQYFVVAQDLSTPTERISCSPATGFIGTSVAQITSAPTTPNSYWYNMSVITQAPFTTDFETWPLTNWGLFEYTTNWDQYEINPTNHCLAANFSYSYDYIISKKISLPNLNDPVMDFKWSHKHDVALVNDYFSVWVSRDSIDWVQIWGVSNTDMDANDGGTYTTPGTFISESVDLNAYKKYPFYICLLVYSEGTNPFFLEDIVVKENDNVLSSPVVTIMNNSGSIVLNWSPVPNANTYKIYKSAAPGGIFTYVTSEVSSPYTVPLTDYRAFYQVIASTQSAKSTRVQIINAIKQKPVKIMNITNGKFIEKL